MQIEGNNGQQKITSCGQSNEMTKLYSKIVNAERRNILCSGFHSQEIMLFWEFNKMESSIDFFKVHYFQTEFISEFYQF